MMAGGKGLIWLELAREAVSGLKMQGRRSFLALLGVMIGSASIVAMMGFAHIARQEVMASFEAVGVDTVQLTPDVQIQPYIEPTVLISALHSDPQIVMSAPMSVAQASISFKGRAAQAGLAAVSSDAMEMLRLSVADGRALSPADGCNGAVVLGNRVATELKARAGDEVYIGGYGYRIIGRLPPAPLQALNPVNPDDTAFIGLGCALRVMPQQGFSHALVRVSSEVEPDDWAQAHVKRMAAHGQMLKASTAREMIATMNNQMNVMGAVLVAMGTVSLLVGGVGVMNVMLMSVMERRREIGLRAAIGATPSEIVFIFVVEAVALSIGGGLLGAVGGVLLTAAACLVLPVSFTFEPMVMMWGTGIAGFVGLVFGIHPAISAARILPVEALRAD